MIVRLFSLVMAIALFGAAGAWAQSGPQSIFVVAEVPVAAEAESAAAAQRLAQEKGRRKALDILLRRLTAEEDWVYLPELAAGQSARATGVIAEEAGMTPSGRSAVTINPSDVASLEEGFSIFDEKSSASTYQARITYRFRPMAVRRLLQDAGLPYSDQQARRALIVPVLKTDRDVYLWESKNPWARAWLARPLTNELTPLVLPRGDRGDIGTVEAEEAVGLETSGLQALARRYNVGQLLVAVADLEERDGVFELSVRLIDSGIDSRAVNRPGGAQSSEAALYDDPDGYGATAARPAESGRGTVLTETFFRGEAGDFPALARRAVEGTVAAYAAGWKERTLVDHADIRQLTLTAWFGSLDEWADIRLALEKTPLVVAMEVGAFNNENAIIDLSITGREDQLILAMRQDNLAVWQAVDGRWNIAEFDRAEQVQQTVNEVRHRNETPEGGQWSGREERAPLSVDSALSSAEQRSSAPGLSGGPIQLEPKSGPERPLPGSEDAIPTEDDFGAIY